jgi:hypothetical protein
MRAFSLRLLRASAFRAFASRALRLIRTASLGVADLRAAAFASAWRLANRTQFIRRNLAIAVAVESAEHFRGLRKFRGVDHAVVVCVECVEKARHRSLHFTPWLLSARCPFALLRAFARRFGRSFGSGGPGGT